MAFNIGPSACTPYLGDQFASLYVGEERVPTVPGSIVFYNSLFIGGNQEVEFMAPLNDGGSEITSLVFSFNGSTITPNSTNFNVLANRYLSSFTGLDLRGQQVSGAAVNAIGQGRFSPPATVL
jgi:hypothetical protein